MPPEGAAGDIGAQPGHQRRLCCRVTVLRCVRVHQAALAVRRLRFVSELNNPDVKKEKMLKKECFRGVRENSSDLARVASEPPGCRCLCGTPAAERCAGGTKR